MTLPCPRIPYGEADFRRIRRNRWLYVDKTPFLRALENERYAFLIRPRRFGKSCWVSLLECYYGRHWAHEFEAIFGGADIGRRPTEDRSRYVVLRFNFSAFDDTLESLQKRFETYCDIKLRGTLRRNTDLFPEEAVQRILAPDSIDGKLGELFEHVTEHDIPLYVLIDEYDNFANTVLAHHGPEAYRAFTHGGGFYRNFFAALKAGAGEAGGLERLFVTGVSPITLDDVTSGFNIGRNISLRPEFNAMLGFTEPEVRGLLETYRECGAFDHDVDTALDVMREWYDGYRFARRAEATVYNTDMVLYFLAESMPNLPMPDDLIDTNVRIDYGKLRHLLLVNQRASKGAKRLNGNFDLLRHVIGEGAADGEVQVSFPLERLDRRENFLSLLHYFGLLSIRGAADGTPQLGIPNQTVRRLLYGHLRDAYDDVGVLSVDLLTFAGLMRRMAVDGEWEPVFDFLRGAVAEQTGVRDYLDGEKVIQGFLAAYLGISRHFVLHTGLELAKGFADVCLEPLAVQYPSLRHGYLIELKYLKRSDDAGEAAVAVAVRETTAQLQLYLADERLARRFPATVRFTGLAVVFHGWEMVYCGPAAEAGQRPGRGQAPRGG